MDSIEIMLTGALFEAHVKICIELFLGNIDMLVYLERFLKCKYW